MGAIEAVNVLATIMGTVMNGIAAAGEVSAIIQKMTAEGRDKMTADEWAVVKAADAAARAALVSAIAAAP